MLLCILYICFGQKYINNITIIENQMPHCKLQCEKKKFTFSVIVSAESLGYNIKSLSCFVWE